ncbi:MAG: hypothetical protein L6405_04805 [Actinomycetia bacterium]|nr:hypothetical protein [Actinomycetes bacterium]
MTNKILRKLIEVEIRLGFMYIPSQSLELMPLNSAKINATINDGNQTLTYNSIHRRIFGLTEWYRKNNLKPGQEVIVTKENDVYKFELIKDVKKIKVEIEKSVDISGLSSTSKGDIVEDRIKELILLKGQGLLSVYKPVTDTEGIDLIVVKNGMFQPIFLQVKSRFNLQKNSFITNINKKTFNPHHSYFIVGAYFDLSNMELFDNLLLIPSNDINKKTNAITIKNRIIYSIVSPLILESKNKWSEYLTNKNELTNKLIEKFVEMSRYIK